MRACWLTVVEPVTTTASGSAPTSGATSAPSSSPESEPGRIRAEPAVDTERLPLLERPQRLGLGILREESQRVPVEVDASRQQVKALPELTEGISRVEGQRFRFAAVDDGGDRFRRHASPLLPSPVRLPHCRTPNADDRVGTREAWRGIAQGNSTLWCGVNVQAHGGNTKRAGERLPSPREIVPSASR